MTGVPKAGQLLAALGPDMAELEATSGASPEGTRALAI